MPVKPDIQLPLGLNLDYGPDKQPKGTNRFNLNVVTATDDGGFAAVHSERGTRYLTDLPGNIVGSIPLDRYYKAVLTDDGSILKVHIEDGSFEVRAKADFNFSTQNPITGISRKVRGCEDVIYWRDSYNADRKFNMDRPEKFKKAGVFDVSLFALNYRAKHPVMDLAVLPTGGNLLLGSYFILAEYLDDFSNVLFTSPISIDPVYINDSDDDGGLNISGHLAEGGGVPPTNKAIQVRITGIPEEISLIRLVVFYATSGDGQTVAAHTVGNLLPVAGGTATYMYRGFDPNGGDTLEDYGAYLVPRTIYDASNAMEQVNGRLMRGPGLMEAVRDLSTFQRAASKICTSYVGKLVPKTEAHLHRTEIGGEVKEYGIVYVFSDGTVSQKFHIPGIIPQGGVPVSEQKKSLYIKMGDAPYCWEGFSWNIYITLNGQNINTGGHIRPGEELLLLAVEPDDDLIVTDFQYQWAGGSLSFPCWTTPDYEIITEQNPIAGDWRYRNTAVKDEVAILPYDTSGKMGYYTSGQKYDNPPNFDDCNEEDYWGEDCAGNPLTGTPVRYHMIPDRSLEPLTVGDDVMMLGVYFDNIEYPHPDIVDHYFVSNVRDGFNSIVQAKGIAVPYVFEGGEPDYKEGRYLQNVWGGTTNNPGIIDPYVLTEDPEFDGYLYNFISPEMLFMGIVPQGEYVIEEGYFDSVYRYTNYGDVKDIFYKKLPYDELGRYCHDHTITDYNLAINQKIWALLRSIGLNRRTNFDEIYNKSFSSRFNIITLGKTAVHNIGNPLKYVSIKRPNLAFPNVYAIRSRRITNLSENVAFNGDGYISRFDMTNISSFEAGDEGIFDLVFGEMLGIVNSTSLVRLEWEWIKDIYIESTVNPYYRHGGTEVCSRYWDGTVPIEKFMMHRVIEPYDGGNEDDGLYKIRDSLCDEYYGYNRDYSKLQDLNIYTPLPFTHDFCAPCQNYYPVTYTWSERSFADDRADNYRIYLPNNVNNVAGNRGSGTAVDEYGGVLVVRMKQAAMLIRPNPQQLQTDESTVYIGTGDFLSLPEQEMNVTHLGYGGQQHPLESVLTDFGLVWVDRARGHVLLFDGKIHNLEPKGLMQWMQQHLPGQEDHCILTFDPGHKRLLITLTDNWTLSYCFMSNQWKSWHSYTPSFYMYGVKTFVSEWRGQLWAHDSDKFAHFYGKAYPVVFEPLFNAQLSFDGHSVWFYALTQIFNDIVGGFVDAHEVTVDQVLIYNQNQSTGLMKVDFEPDQLKRIRYAPDEVAVVHTDRMYKIALIRDKSTDDAIFAVGPGTYRQDGQGYMDKVPANVDINMPQVKQANFNGKWMAVRLHFTNPDYRITFNLAALMEWYHNR